MDKSTAERFRIIEQIEEKRNSRVITYFLSDRKGAAVAQISEDAVRHLYDHLRAIGKTDRVDLFLYSVGGQVEVPWRIVTMIREYAQSFRVLVPYKAMSAATMICLGADSIVMGPKGELGPIDPKLSIQRGREGGTLVQDDIAVEDVMAFVLFLKDKAGLTDQQAIASALAPLFGKLEPWILGQLNRMHTHIRLVARKLITSQKTPLDEQKIQAIVETLAEKTYQHGHAIGRREAEEIGFTIERPEPEVECLMWQLFECYENLCQMKIPIDPWTFIPGNEDHHKQTLVIGCIESTGKSHQFSADLNLRKKRQAPPQLNLNFALNLNLPAHLQPNQLPAGVQQAIQQMMGQLQQQVEKVVREQLIAQMPVLDIEGRVEAGAWRQEI